MLVKKGYLITKLAVYLVLLCLVFCMLQGHILIQSNCFYRGTFNIECPTCGFTRAFYALIRGDVSGAFSYNPLLVAVIAPAVLFAVCQDIFLSIKRLVLGTGAPSFIEFILSPKKFFKTE